MSSSSSTQSSKQEQPRINEQEHRPPQRPTHILLGITGSVAAIKGPELALTLAKELHAIVIILLTKGGENFWLKANEYDQVAWDAFCNFTNTPTFTNVNNNNADGDDRGVSSILAQRNSNIIGKEDEHNDFKGQIELCKAEDEWNGWNKIGDPVLHIQLRDWADIAVIAPLSAHTLSKISNGLCDDTLSCVLRAWDYRYSSSASTTRKRKPIVVAPAMNTAMWEHPITKSQLDIMKYFWNVQHQQRGNDNLRMAATTTATFTTKACQTYVVEPQVKTLACGEVGTGAMANVSDILASVAVALATSATFSEDWMTKDE